MVCSTDRSTDNVKILTAENTDCRIVIRIDIIVVRIFLPTLLILRTTATTRSTYYHHPCYTCATVPRCHPSWPAIQSFFDSASAYKQKKARFWVWMAGTSGAFFDFKSADLTNARAVHRRGPGIRRTQHLLKRNTGGATLYVWIAKRDIESKEM
jgi:hypothetical protein